MLSPFSLGQGHSDKNFDVQLLVELLNEGFEADSVGPLERRTGGGTWPNVTTPLATLQNVALHAVKRSVRKIP